MFLKLAVNVAFSDLSLALTELSRSGLGMGAGKQQSQC